MVMQDDRKGFLICAAAGYTCLVFSLVVYVLETNFVKAGWIGERTPNAFVCLYMASLFLFPASLCYARMVAKSQQADSKGPTTEVAPSRGLITWTVLFTLAIALVVEGFAVGMEAAFRASGLE